MDSRNAHLFVVDPLHMARLRSDLNKQAALARIHTYSLIKGAEHGWLGACNSVTEMLVVLHLGCGMSSREVVLAKGHAAAAQYALMYATGEIEGSRLFHYKDGSAGADVCLEAHSDMHSDTGSLGMTLSCVIGMALCDGNNLNPLRRRAVILGDGELQEGQVWEALMTISHRCLHCVTVLVDSNGYQSELRTDEVKRIPDLAGALKGFGFEVIEVEDGHSLDDIRDAWDRAGKETRRPSVIICHTIKHPRPGSWHTRVPSWSEYHSMVDLQQQLVADDGVTEQWRQFKQRNENVPLPAPLREPISTDSTGKAFGRRLVSLLEQRPELRILDGDLAASLALSGVSHPHVFQYGISEQDMVSAAGGMALAGITPVVHTYSNFMKRAYENMFINLVQGSIVIYAGTYSGLCYHTDGKSHQSFTDMSSFSSLPDLVCVDPLSAKHAATLAEYVICNQERPRKSFYFRLRRTPASDALVSRVDEALLDRGAGVALLHAPLEVLADGNKEISFVTMGTVATELALQCCAHPTFAGKASVYAVPALKFEGFKWGSALDGNVVITIEDEMGALASFVKASLTNNKKVISKCCTKAGPSFRTLSECLTHHGFTVDAICELYRQRLLC